MQHLIGISGYKQAGKDTVARIIQWLSDTEEDGIAFPLGDYLDPQRKANSFGKSIYQTKQFAGVLKQMVCLMLGCTLADLENEEFKNTPLGPEWDRWYTIYEDSERISQYFVSIEEAEEYLWQRESVRFYGSGGYKHIKQQVTPRIILQELGTEGIRGIHPDAHVNMLFKDYKPSYEYNPAYDSKGIYDVTEEFELSNPPMNPRWIITDVRFPNELERIKQYGGVIIRVVDPRKEARDLHASETALDNHQFEFNIRNDGTIEELVEATRFIYQAIQTQWQSNH